MADPRGSVGEQRGGRNSWPRRYDLCLGCARFRSPRRTHGRARRLRGWEAVTGPLLVSVGELEQRWFGVRPTEQLDSDRDATRGKSGRYGDRRKAGDRREKTVALHL